MQMCRTKKLSNKKINFTKKNVKRKLQVKIKIFHLKKCPKIKTVIVIKIFHNYFSIKRKIQKYISIMTSQATYQ